MMDIQPPEQPTPILITVSPDELKRLMAREIDTYEEHQYRSFLSQFDEGRVPELIQALSKGNSDGKRYLLEYQKRFGTQRFEQFIDRIYEETDTGTHVKLSDLSGEGERELFTQLFALSQPDTNYVDSITRRDAMRRVGQAAKYLLAAEAVLGTGSLVGFACTNDNDPKQQRALTRYNEYVVVPVGIVCSGVIAVHYGYENKVDHINAQLEQIERKLNLVEDAINQLVDRSRAHRKAARNGELGFESGR